VNNVTRNTIRVLRGLFVFWVLSTIFVIVLFAVRWSVRPPSETTLSSPLALSFLLPTVITGIFVLLPGLDRYIGRLYLPVSLAMTILSFSLQSGVAFLNPGARVQITLPTGRELSVFWASAELVLLVLVPCVLAGAAYGLRGALAAATFATVIHLALGVAIQLLGTPLRGFLVFLPLRIAVLYGFSVITGYLSDTWRRERDAAEEANRQLRGYAATIEHLATSRERVRLARAMHDTLAHSLSALVIQLEAIEALEETDPEAAKGQFEKAKRIARVGLDETRRAILDLRSSPVEELGLSGALQQLVERFSQHNGIRAGWTVEGKPVPLMPVQANALYRIAEEALVNVERHAQAHQVNVALCYTDGVSLEIQDDGRGFDLSQVDRQRYGLLGITERAALVDAQVAIHSSPDGGTQVIVHIAEPWEG
jgi:signal transduction histidine kinase